MKNYILIVFVVLLPWACKSVSKSELKHDLENPVGSSSRYFWSSQTKDEYIKNTLAGQFEGISAKDLLSDNHPLAKRLQYWADKHNAMLRERYPEMVGHVPSPIINIILSNEEAAFKGDAPVCLNNVFFNASGKTDPKNTDSNNL
ncbi:MAG: hypothetical protein EOP07_10430 [Proteobacteria bacterium]|nr:MAG: hypothetical protein EOP07_10430 [Pseudomonadota bacterium]